MIRSTLAYQKHYVEVVDVEVVDVEVGDAEVPLPNAQDDEAVAVIGQPGLEVTQKSCCFVAGDWVNHARDLRYYSGGAVLGVLVEGKKEFGLEGALGVGDPHPVRD